MLFDKAKQIIKVIDTIIKERPLNVFYWGTTSIPSQFELIDGQQRTISICEFVTDKYTIDYNGEAKKFCTLPLDIKNKILDYELTIYRCDGDDSEKLEWFETINIASEPLTTQELRNAVYTGMWLSDAKRYFSKSNCPALNIGKDYVRGNANRQEILEEVLKWAADADNMKIDEYMAAHKNDADAKALWEYFERVIDWVKATFTDYYKDMNKVMWGYLYNRYSKKCSVDKNNNILCTYYNSTPGIHTHDEMLMEIRRLHDDDDVTSQQGIYDFVLSGNERKLSIRKFPDKIKRAVFDKQGVICAYCEQPFDYDDLVCDHITPWSKGGKTVKGNCQLLCVKCNSSKSNKSEKPSNESTCINCGKPVKKGMYCQFCGTKN